MLALILIVSVVWVCVLLWALSNPQANGVVGDSVNVATSLFTGFTLVGLIIAILIQREELREIKEDRKDTQKMLEEQRKQTLELKNSQDQKNELDREAYFVQMVNASVQNGVRFAEGNQSERTKVSGKIKTTIRDDGESALFRKSMIAFRYFDGASEDFEGLWMHLNERLGHIAASFIQALKLANLAPPRVQDSLTEYVLSSISPSLAYLFRFMAEYKKEENTSEFLDLASRLEEGYIANHVALKQTFEDRS